MATLAVSPVPAARTRWSGRILSALPALFLLLDGAMKLANIPEVIQASEKAGIPGHLLPLIGVVLLCCVALYIIPRTAPIGAVLLTGYLGGAVLTHLRIGDPVFTHVLAPVYFAVFLWGGLYLRDERVRRLVR